MSYYSELQKMYIFLETILKTGEMTKNRVILILTNKFEVSQRSILQRLELLEAEGYIEIDKDTIKWL